MYYIFAHFYSRYRDYLKNDAFKYMDEQSGEEEFTLVYDKWNTANEVC